MAKKIFSIAFYSIRQRATEPRIITLFILMSVFIWNHISVIGDLTPLTGLKTNPLIFPFFSSDPLNQLILFAGVIFLFADAPFINEGQSYVIIRCNRLSWIMGQIVYIVMASAIYFMILMCVSVIILLPNGTFATNGWGKIVNTLAQTNAGRQINLQFTISEKITSFYTPFEAFGLCFFLNWGCASFLGLTIFILNMKFNRGIGLVFCAMILFFDLLVLNALPIIFYYFSPVSISRLTLLDPLNVLRFPTINYSIIFYSIGSVILSILLIINFKNESIESSSEF